MVYDIASPIFGARKDWGGNTFAPMRCFLGIFFLFFSRNDGNVLGELDESIR